MSDTKISIITPTFNHEQFIKKCIESVIAQTYRNWEMIIVDDYSTDKTFEIANSYSDKRIKVIRPESKNGLSNLSDTYNFALKISVGNIIAILEGDDEWPSQKLEHQVPYFLSSETNICFSRGEYIDENSKNIGFSSLQKNREIKNDAKFFRQMFYGNIIDPSPTILIKKNILTKIGGFKQDANCFTIDLPTWLEIAKYGNILYTPLSCGKYRIHQSQSTIEQYSQIIEGRISFITYYFEKNKDFLIEKGISERDLILAIKWNKFLIKLKLKTNIKFDRETILLFKESPLNIKTKIFAAIILQKTKINFDSMRKLKKIIGI